MFNESSDSEYYSEATVSGISEEDLPQFDQSAYIIPPIRSQILVESGNNPNFPRVTVSHYFVIQMFYFAILIGVKINGL